ncbi:MAG: DUF2252 domain-containing protein [Burkholderiales bacterium]|nr:DUF2252 domain-containing protein [Burkholderiales bacterium]
MLNVVRRIQKANEGRDPERLAMKYQALRSGPFPFLRGTCHLFYDRMPTGGVFKSAPLVWACGDLHLENFGSYKGDNRLVYFDINDFDESALAPASWDLLRMLTSVLVGAHDFVDEAADAERLCRSFLAAYGEAILQGKARWVERETAHGMVGDLLKGLQARSREQFLDRRTVVDGKVRRLRIDGQNALAATDTQRAKILKFMKGVASKQARPEFYKVIDVAQRIAGTGSLGVERYVILVEGKGSPHGNYLLDLKEALPSSLVGHVKVTQPEWATQAHRVVALQRRMQAISMAFLQPVVIGKKSYVLRGLQPAQDRVALENSHHDVERLADVMAVMGDVVAWAQLRSSGRQGAASADQLIGFASRKKWKSELLSAAQDCAKQVRLDWVSYCQGHDAGAFTADQKTTRSKAGC